MINPTTAIMSDLISEVPVTLLRTMNPKTIREKYSGGPKASAASAKGGARKTRPKMPDRAGDERTDGAHGQRRTGPPLLGHLVAVDAGDHGGGLARDVQENGGGGAAVHGPVIDSGEHDDGRSRIEAEGRRDEESDAGDGPESRQDADQGADDRPDQAVEQVGEPWSAIPKPLHQMPGEIQTCRRLLQIPIQPLGQGDLEPLDEQEIGNRGRWSESDRIVRIDRRFIPRILKQGHHQEKGDQRIPQGIEEQGGQSASCARRTARTGVRRPGDCPGGGFLFRDALSFSQKKIQEEKGP